MTRPTITAFAFVLVAAAGVACTSYPAEPTAPTFTKDVHPIFMAHCVRCHGAQDMLSKEKINGVDSPGGTIQCYLDRYDDKDSCAPVDGGVPVTCQPGAHTCATLFKPFMTGYIHVDEKSTSLRMPPAPSPPLNEWELTVLDRWIEMPLP